MGGNATEAADPLPRATDLFLLPGALAFGPAPLRLRTLLGSCVAVVVWHPVLRLGGMCHYLLPQRGAQRLGAPADGHYATEALALLTDCMQTYAAAAQFRAYICGGASCIERGAPTAGLSDIGGSNVEAADQWCLEQGLAVWHRDTGGGAGRHVHFDMANGALQVRATEAPTPNQQR